MRATAWRGEKKEERVKSLNSDWNASKANVSKRAFCLPLDCSHFIPQATPTTALMPDNEEVDQKPDVKPEKITITVRGTDGAGTTFSSSPTTRN